MDSTERIRSEDRERLLIVSMSNNSNLTASPLAIVALKITEGGGGLKRAESKRDAITITTNSPNLGV